MIKNINELPTIPNVQEMEDQYGQNLDKIYQDHNKIIGMILVEEEDLIEMHKQHVDEVINIEKSEMGLINDVDKSGSDIEKYVHQLDQMLIKKMHMVAQMRKKLVDFNAHLQMEKMLQNIYHKKQTEMDDENNSDNYLNHYDSVEYDDEDMQPPQQDGDGMIMGVGMGNSNITRNFAKMSSNHAKGANLLPGLNGDREENMDDGDENL